MAADVDAYPWTVSPVQLSQPSPWLPSFVIRDLYSTLFIYDGAWTLSLAQGGFLRNEQLPVDDRSGALQWALSLYPSRGRTRHHVIVFERPRPRRGPAEPFPARVKPGPGHLDTAATPEDSV